jgi:hypothetical protein
VAHWRGKGEMILETYILQANPEPKEGYAACELIFHWRGHTKG